MKIIHISPAYVLVLAGEELHMKVLSDGLASHGHDVMVLTVNAWRRQISFAVSAMGAGASLARLGVHGTVLGRWVPECAAVSQ